ncbi:tetratricopeptide repeat protein [Acidihalobacter ferrooxydans]|uniref:Uncharacterized protein n=1 Tax=Acidihalobacter ferrooxydans TaxID=1765967 RepID=A0A1P8UHY6_9GAMM|nr:tetratricopeptide repeat protein [Acidihalobacter ferrooxydans]APZ43450.1 hypothetical protein BW247_10425 [Acidihalobacter ferrooxydans]
MTIRHNTYLRLLMVLGAVWLAGCATAPRPLAPPSKQATPAVAPPSGLQGTPERNPRSMPAAALALATAADAAARRQDWSQASRQLERALSIAPRNPLLWQRLAAVRYSQGEYRQAQTLALKSNSFAAGERAVRQINWRIIAASRRALGDASGAAAATRRAQAQ